MAEFSWLGIPGNHTGAQFDALLALYPTQTAAVTDTASDVVFIGTGLVDANLIVDISAATGGSSLKLQFATDEAFTTPVTLATFDIPATAAGKRGKFAFRNAFGAEQPYGYVRLMPTVGTSLTLMAWIDKKN